MQSVSSRGVRQYTRALVHLKDRKNRFPIDAIENAPIAAPNNEMLTIVVPMMD